MRIYSFKIAEIFVRLTEKWKWKCAFTLISFNIIVLIGFPVKLISLQER